MLFFIADEDFDRRIVRGWLRRKSNLDLVRAQDVGLLGACDEKLLEWASDNNRILVTHDKRTMPHHVANRLDAGLHIPGVLIVNRRVAIRSCIEELLLIAECSEAGEWQDQVIYLPFS
jgi:predicted nuclease of predicted toxin-antitoxin system